MFAVHMAWSTTLELNPIILLFFIPLHQLVPHLPYLSPVPLCNVSWGLGVCSALVRYVSPCRLVLEVRLFPSPSLRCFGLFAFQGWPGLGRCVCVCDIWTDVKLLFCSFYLAGGPSMCRERWPNKTKRPQYMRISRLITVTYMLLHLFLSTSTLLDSVSNGSLQWSISCLVCVKARRAPQGDLNPAAVSKAKDDSFK